MALENVQFGPFVVYWVVIEGEDNQHGQHNNHHDNQQHGQHHLHPLPARDCPERSESPQRSETSKGGQVGVALHGKAYHGHLEIKNDLEILHGWGGG